MDEEARTTRIKVKLGQFEFEGEGAATLVEKQFENFLAAVQKVPSGKVVATEGVALQEEQKNPPLPLLPPPPADQAVPPPPDKELDRVFAVDGKGVVSLRLLPQGKNRNADSFLLLLYGYGVLSDRQDVMATELMRAAKQSGVQVERIDRALAHHRALTTSGGFAKGKRYGLNNQGIREAQEIIKKMLG